jgi:CRP-like cAMP-binding protein
VELSAAAADEFRQGAKLAAMDHDARRALLLGHPLLEGVDADNLERLLDAVTIKQVPRGMLLNTPGISPGLLHLVIRGRLRAYQLTADGHQLLLELIQAGGFDGLLSVAGRRGHFTEAEDDSLVVSLTMAQLERLIGFEPRIARNLLRLILDRLERREVHLEAIALHDPTKRLARQLLALARSLGAREGASVVLTPRITHQMLADMLGVRRETVTLHLGRLADLGAVSTRRGRLVLDPGLLRKVVDYPDGVESPG